MTQKTQKELILDHLRNFGTLEPLEALREYGIYRLGARISELRSQGGGSNQQGNGRLKEQHNRQDGSFRKVQTNSNARSSKRASKPIKSQQYGTRNHHRAAE